MLVRATDGTRLLTYTFGSSLSLNLLTRQITLRRARQVSQEHARLPPGAAPALAPAFTTATAAAPASAPVAASAAAAAAAAVAGAGGLVVPRRQLACIDGQGAQQRGSQLVETAAYSPSKLTRRRRPHCTPCGGEENAPPGGAHASPGGAHARVQRVRHDRLLAQAHRPPLPTYTQRT